MIKALIIDDEPLARSVIRSFLADVADVTIVDECGNGFEGMKAIQEQKPDLLFLDVQMPKLNGFELLELLDELPAVIFSTAFDQYALKAFELNAADYLLKPYTKARFLEALQRARTKLQNEDKSEELKIVKTVREYGGEIDRIAVRNGTKIVIIPTSEINYIEAQDDYVAIHSNGKKYLKQLTMKYLESVLPEHDFVRVHRSYIVSFGDIDRLEAYSKDGYIAILLSGEKIPVSRRGYQLLRSRLEF